MPYNPEAKKVGKLIKAVNFKAGAGLPRLLSDLRQRLVTGEWCQLLTLLQDGMMSLD
jgi:hypothetical protein